MKEETRNNNDPTCRSSTVSSMLIILESSHLTPRYMDRVMLDSLSLIWQNIMLENRKLYEVISDFTADGKCQRNMIMMLMNVSKMRFTSFTSFPRVLCVFYKPRRILDMFVRKCCILSTSNISRMWGVMMTSTTLDLLVGGGSSSFSYSLSMQNWWEQWRPLPGAGECPSVELTRYASPNIKT